MRWRACGRSSRISSRCPSPTGRSLAGSSLSAMDDIPRRCFVHVGLPKTGTTYLQSILWRSRDELARQGISLLPHENGAPRSVRLMLATRDRLRKGVDPVNRAQVFRALRAQLEETSTPNVLISQEQLA